MPLCFQRRVEVQEIGEQRVGIFAGLQSLMKGHGGTAHVLRGAEAMLAYDMAVRKSRQECEIDRKRRPLRVGGARQGRFEHGLAQVEDVVEPVSVLPGDPVAIRRRRPWPA